MTFLKLCLVQVKWFQKLGFSEVLKKIFFMFLFISEKFSGLKIRSYNNPEHYQNQKLILQMESYENKKKTF